MPERPSCAHRSRQALNHPSLDDHGLFAGEPANGGGLP